MDRGTWPATVHGFAKSDTAEGLTLSLSLFTFGGSMGATPTHHTFLLFRPKYSAFIAINLPIVTDKVQVF